jgi:hypothetical protein
MHVAALGPEDQHRDGASKLRDVVTPPRWADLRPAFRPPDHRGLETAIDAATPDAGARDAGRTRHYRQPFPPRLIAGGSVALLAGAAIAPRAAASPAGDDAEIRRLFAEWLPLRRRYCFLGDQVAQMDDDEIDHELRDVLVPAMHVLAEKIADLRGTTLEGLRAKATVLLSYTGYHAR